MKSFIFMGYEFLSSFIPFLAVFLLFRSLHKKRSLHISKASYTATIVFAFYVTAVYHFTGAGTLYDGLLYQLELNREQINLIPFSQGIDLIPYVLNILLFLPLGILVPVIWKRKDRPANILITGFSFSLLIEVSQLLNNRSTDIDDVILNTLGALIGFVLYRYLNNLYWRTSKGKFALQSIPNVDMELPIYIVVLFIGRFLFFNELGMAKLLYGF